MYCAPFKRIFNEIVKRKKLNLIINEDCVRYIVCDQFKKHLFINSFRIELEKKYFDLDKSTPLSKLSEMDVFIKTKKAICIEIKYIANQSTQMNHTDIAGQCINDIIRLSTIKENYTKLFFCFCENQIHDYFINSHNTKVNVEYRNFLSDLFRGKNHQINLDKEKTGIRTFPKSFLKQISFNQNNICKARQRSHYKNTGLHLYVFEIL